MTDELRKQIKQEYTKGASPLSLALSHRLEVAEVYEVLGMNDMLTVTFTGDQLDQMIPGVQVNNGESYNVPYTKN